MTGAPATLRDVSADLLTGGIGVRFRATGHSMAPTIRNGEMVEVAPRTARELRPGDVALYEGDRGLIAHRVVAIDGDTVRLRGDAARSEDTPVESKRVLGRVVSVQRGGRWTKVTGPRVWLSLKLRRPPGGFRSALAIS